MNELRLLAKFEQTPSEQQKREIEAELRAFLLAIDPNASLTVKSGEGSWWIIILTWVGEQFASWLVSKGFDKIAKDLKPKKSLPESEFPSELATTDPENREQGFPQPERVTPAAALLDEMSTLMEKIDKTGSKTKIVMGVYREGYGHVADLTKERDEITFTLVQTDSIDDFNSRTNS